MSHTAYIDGGARGNPGPSAAGVQIADPLGRVIFAGGLFLGHQTNNEAEYAGLLLALDLLHAIGAEQICIRSDSELLVRQMQGRYRVKAVNLKPLYECAASRLGGFKQHQFEHIRREQNKDADGLVNQALDVVADVVLIDARNLLSQIRHPSVVPTPAKQGSLFHDEPFASGEPARSRSGGPPVQGRSGSPDSGVTVTVLKPPRAGGCPARIRAGQVFQFADTVPAGLCVHACGAMIEAVLAMQSVVGEGTEPIEPITATCPTPNCGAVFQVSAKTS